MEQNAVVKWVRFEHFTGQKWCPESLPIVGVVYDRNETAMLTLRTWPTGHFEHYNPVRRVRVTEEIGGLA